MAGRGLAELLSGTCDSQVNPWEYLVGLGRRFGVPVYPSLSESRVLGETRYRRTLSKATVRGPCAWAAGADGIYLFNYFDPRRAAGTTWAIRRLCAKDKLYFVTPRNGSPDRYLAEARRFPHVPVLTPSDPWPVPDDKSAELELPVGDDLAWAQRSGLKPQVTCHVQTLGTGRLAVSLNGRELAPTRPAWALWFSDFPVPDGSPPSAA